MGAEHARDARSSIVGLASERRNVGRGRSRNPARMALAAGVFLALLLPLVGVAAASLQEPTAPDLLDPLSVPRYVNQLTSPPPVYVPTLVKDDLGRVVSQEYGVEMRSFTQQILPPPFPETPVWGYAGLAQDAITGAPLGVVQHSPGPSFEAVRHIPINVTWTNTITASHMFAVDPTIHWADPNGVGMPEPPFEPYPPGFPDAQSPVPLVTHLHGGEVQSTSDGGPETWFTWDGIHGPDYSTYRATDPDSAVFHYPNGQPATTLWYHDHALGITRINVMSGLAGFYLLRDPGDPIAPLLPSGKYEMPLAIQDRIFQANGEFYSPSDGINPDVHPYWMPEFFGNTIMVNGLVWPNMNVDRGQYRFRLLDGSNARFYTLSFSNLMPFTVIGTDGGYLRSPAPVTQLTMAPGERYDILVDFSNLAPGTTVLLKNTAKAPFPTGTPPQGATVGQIMQFTVTSGLGPAPAELPPTLNPTLETGFPSLPAPDPRRTLVLFEEEGPEGPLGVFLNGQTWDAPVSETPTLGTTEEWVIVNPTADTHPIHLHLVQFQIVSRQRIRAEAYLDAWIEQNGEEPPYMFTPTSLAVDHYLKGRPRYAVPMEQGWKDTLQVHPGEVTVIRVRFAPIDGTAEYPFDATVDPGYVWHCHILDHEDNEMMRPYTVAAPATVAKP